MVAIAVIAIALIPLLRLHLLSLDATLYAQDLTTAVGLAQEKMAEMASSPEPGERHGTFDAAIYKRFSWQTSIGESEEVSLPNLERALRGPGGLRIPAAFSQFAAATAVPVGNRTGPFRHLPRALQRGGCVS
jgi:hypothetical protein